MAEMKRKISTNVLVLGIVSFLNDVASEMVYPIVPIFLMTVLGAPAVVVGVIEGIADATSKILMAFTGIASDKVQKRKEFVIWGYSFSTLSHLIMSLAHIWPVVLVGRVINRTGKGLRTSARDALITESTDKADRGRSFGWHRMMDSAGSVLGPLLSIVLLKVLNDNYHQLFFVAFIPALIGVLLIISFVKEKKKEALSLEGIRFQWGKTNASFRIFLLISFIFTLGNSSDVFMILRAQDLGLSIGLTIFTYVLASLTNALFSMPLFGFSFICFRLFNVWFDKHSNSSLGSFPYLWYLLSYDRRCGQGLHFQTSSS
jgi:Na+/melibiose symporter-like transporter